MKVLRSYADDDSEFQGVAVFKPGNIYPLNNRWPLFLIEQIGGKLVIDMSAWGQCATLDQIRNWARSPARKWDYNRICMRYVFHGKLLLVERVA